MPYRGKVGDVLHRIRGHIRSAVSYGGEVMLSDLRRRVLADPAAYLIPLSAASRRESYER